MSNTLIYIDGELVDLLPETIVACTFQAMEIGDIKKRSISYTNHVKLPATSTNNRIFNHANNAKSKSRKPYTKVNVRVVQNGIEIMRNAVGILHRSGGGEYELGIFEGALNFFDTIKGKYMDEMDLEVYGVIDDDYISDFNNQVASGACPVIDYGRMFVPHDILSNSEFDGYAFDPWANIDEDSPYTTTGQAWTSNLVVDDNRIGVTLQTTAPNNQSKYLRAPYKFYQGIQYRILIAFEVTQGTAAGDLEVELHGDGDTVMVQYIGAKAMSTVGDYTFDFTFTADDHYQLIAILASHSLAVDSKIVRLLRIDVEPQQVIDIKAPYYLPTLSVSHALNQIRDDSGFDITRSLDSAGQVLISELAFTFSKSELRYNSRLTDKYRFIAHATGSQVVSSITESTQLIEFTDVRYNGSAGWYDESNSEYNIPVLGFDLRIRMFVRLTVNVTSITTDAQIRFWLVNGLLLMEDDYGNSLVEILTTTGIHTITLEFPTIIGNAAAGYQVKVNGSGSGDSVQILSGEFFCEIDNTPIGRRHLSNLIMPDMLQTDFFTEFLYRFGFLLRDSGSTLVLKPLQDIISDRDNAKDWTSKRDMSFPESIEYIHNSYAQINYFEDSSDNNPEARGRFLVDNEHLPDDKTIYTSQFVIPEYVNVGGIRIIRIPVFDFESDDPLKVSDNFEPGVRLVHLRGRDSARDPQVKYNGVVDTSYTLAVYDDPGSDVKTNWQYFIDNYYSNLETCLDESKVITRYYFLSEIDIATLDLTKLIYDDGIYFKIEKVSNYVPGKSTKVELFKVS